MALSPHLPADSRVFCAFDSHTVGEATRIIYDGFPPLEGDTMMARKQFLQTHYDHYRRALMLEPRGHRDMFGALLTPPLHPEADIGVIFMDTGGYLNMCGHGSIGAATVAVETGLVPAKEPLTEVVLEAPCGLIRAEVALKAGRVQEVSIFNVPSFLYKRDVSLSIAGYGTITLDIAFGGSFFALVGQDAHGTPITPERVEDFVDLGMKIRRKLNRTLSVHHPYLDITTVDLVEFYGPPAHPDAHKRNIVVFGDGQVDRSPCGTGTSAKLAALYARGELALDEPFVYESVTGSLFRGVATREIAIGPYTGIIPRITGSAYITGHSQWMIDPRDPLAYGFRFGAEPQTPPLGVRARIVKAAWALFHAFGTEGVTQADIAAKAGVTQSELTAQFQTKEALYATLSDLFDQKYAELLLEMNPRISHYEKLLFLNRELFQMIEQIVPRALLAASYAAQMQAGAPKNLMDKSRLYYRLLTQIIEDGCRQGDFRTDTSPEDLAQAYAQLERGMLYDWCVHEGGYNLTEYSQRMLPVYLKSFMR